jgi:hypothetical protein
VGTIILYKEFKWYSDVYTVADCQRKIASLDICTTKATSHAVLKYSRLSLGMNIYLRMKDEK